MELFVYGSNLSEICQQLVSHVCSVVYLNVFTPLIDTSDE